VDGVVFATVGLWFLPRWGYGFCHGGGVVFATVGLWFLPRWGYGVNIDISGGA